MEIQHQLISLNLLFSELKQKKKKLLTFVTLSKIGQILLRAKEGSFERKEIKNEKRLQSLTMGWSLEDLFFCGCEVSIERLQGRGCDPGEL